LPKVKFREERILSQKKKQTATMSKNPALTNKEVQDILVRARKKKWAKMVKLEAEEKRNIEWIS
jgi:hypothetical protein